MSADEIRAVQKVRHEEESRQAAAAVRDQVSDDAFISDAGKSMFTVERNVWTLTVSTFEWGQVEGEVTFGREEAARLRDFLTAALVDEGTGQ
ncbi:hypothetical protein [Curtobacterium sp. MCBD17_040]|uniref:hypothetical protein n=1 Tax=Curtobacterium sp. MCBD17_040 TaxID=2175674 RepID=UPI000DA932CC|nr:hypothetical protein [Curtobacterium sp. MCBD17_040]WIB65474.1 hypothetical protein DEI94_19060 [Curtobacterium sp. MCBD17_040]